MLSFCLYIKMYTKHIALNSPVPRVLEDVQQLWFHANLSRMSGFASTMLVFEIDFLLFLKRFNGICRIVYIFDRECKTRA